MAFALRKPLPSLPSRSVSVCRVHTCVRCKSAVDSSEPCSFVQWIVQICPTCAGQEHALAHLPNSQRPWGAGLARISRA